jgi:hypothetical protein
VEAEAENSAEIAKQNPSDTLSQFLLSCCVEFGTSPAVARYCNERCNEFVDAEGACSFEWSISTRLYNRSLTDFDCLHVTEREGNIWCKCHHSARQCPQPDQGNGTGELLPLVCD